MIAFGPVPSRRLGSSLGINHVPPKHCTYSCVYCQVGRTTALEITRQSFFPLDQILQEVERKISESVKLKKPIDYLTLVPDGEPTLDLNLDRLILGLKPFGIPVAVISNASLMDRVDVQEALMLVDWVSLKVDAVNDTDWHRINRPCRQLSLSSILSGILTFRNNFRGDLVTETVLVSGINDSEEAIDNLASYLLELQPMRSYLSIPTRPPAEPWVKVPDADSLQNILQRISKKVPFIDILFEAEDSGFISTGNIVEDILGITAVHPIRQDALQIMLAGAGENWKIVEELLASRKIVCIQYREEKFYLRNFRGPTAIA